MQGGTVSKTAWINIPWLPGRWAADRVRSTPETRSSPSGGWGSKVKVSGGLVSLGDPSFSLRTAISPLGSPEVGVCRVLTPPYKDTSQIGWAPAIGLCRA